MKVLVINAGSSSIKYQLIDMQTEQAIAKGICERIGIEGSLLKHKDSAGKEAVIKEAMPTHNEAIGYILNALITYGAIKSLDEITAIGHRVVHGGETFKSSAVINETTLQQIADISDLAPLHNPANIIGIKACQAAMPKALNVAVFDTTFHANMPSYAFMYGIDYKDYEDYKVRRYGFHGTSHLFVNAEAEKLMGKKGKVITCHLGNGASIAAVDNGVSVDTSMGLTPLEGLIMGTRSGDIDPAAIDFLMAKKGENIKQTTDYLNKKCGVLGISGVSSDFRDLTAAAAEKNPRAVLALEMFSYRVRKYIGEYTAAMDGVDAIVFTGGVGENTPEVRELVLSNLTYLGISFDKKLNYSMPRGVITTLSNEDSKVKVYIIPTNEELVIARETAALT